MLLRRRGLRRKQRTVIQKRPTSVFNLALLGLLLRRLLLGSWLPSSLLGRSLFRGLLNRSLLDGGLSGGPLVGSRGCRDRVLGRSGGHCGHRLRNGSRDDHLD